MKIIKSEFITSDYNIYTKYVHWSRIYEWKYVLDFIENNNIKSIHNTACGGLNSGDCLHLTFASDLDSKCDTVIHSDLWGNGYLGTDIKPDIDNFITYDITKPFDRKFDLVLNISTIEHLPTDYIEITINNLLNQVNDGGYLILTFDYPDVDLLQINKIFNTTITEPINSIKGGRLRVILIHIQK
jgi:hypothetical protein